MHLRGDPERGWHGVERGEPLPGRDPGTASASWDELVESGIGLEVVSGEARGDRPHQLNRDASFTRGDEEILAVEALLDKRLLAVLLALGERPRQAREFRSLRVLVAKRVRVKKKVRVREPGGLGYREVEKEVEEDRMVPQPLPASTLSRILARLRGAGLVEEYRGLDARRRYYRLTPRGRQVYEKARSHILSLLRRVAKENSLAWDRFEEIARELGQPPDQLARHLGLETEETPLGRQVRLA